ncbi:MAG: hypothetical protein L3J58_04710, partial [Emcibacter sp.]|nr:hypothetical protein [Emcibacter sp.]
WQDWTAETEQTLGDPDDFVRWATANGKLAPRPQDVSKMLRRQVTAALRSVKRYDEDGAFEYRALQSVTLFDDGTSRKQYFDTDTGGTQNLRQKSTKQRRDAIANHVYRAHCDVERMNKMFPKESQLNFFADFSDDIAEKRAADLIARDAKGDAA